MIVLIIILYFYFKDCKEIGKDKLANSLFDRLLASAMFIFFEIGIFLALF